MGNPFNKFKTAILFYVIYILFAIVLNMLVRGDMFNPGLGFFMIVLLIPISIILIIIRVINYSRK